MQTIIILYKSKHIADITMYNYLIELSREEFYKNHKVFTSDWPNNAEHFEAILKQSGLPIYYYDADGFFNLICTQYRSYKYFFNRMRDDIRYEVVFADYITKMPSRCLLRLYTIINKINYTYSPAAIHIEPGKIEAISRTYADDGLINFTLFRDWVKNGDGIIRQFRSVVSKDEELMKYITFI